MSVVVDVVEGQTSAIDMQLEGTDPFTKAKTNPNLGGATVVLQLHRPDGTPVATQGVVSIPSPAEGKVRFTPHANDFVGVAPSQLAGRWKVTIASEVTYFPSGTPDTWRVWK